MSYDEASKTTTRPDGSKITDIDMARGAPEAKLPLVILPPGHPMLWRPASAVENVGTQVLPHLLEMRQIMEKGAVRAIGLSAPQVGIGLQFFITAFPEMPVVVNPQVVEYSKATEVDVEGCVSWGLPVRRTEVRRSRWVRVLFETGDKRMVQVKLFHLKARVFQHEFDHLNGINIFGRPS